MSRWSKKKEVVMVELWLREGELEVDMHAKRREMRAGGTLRVGRVERVKCSRRAPACYFLAADASRARYLSPHLDQRGRTTTKVIPLSRHSCFITKKLHEGFLSELALLITRFSFFSNRTALFSESAHPTGLEG